MNSLDKILEGYDLEAQESEKLDGYASTNFRIKCKGVNYLLKHYKKASEYNLVCEEEKILNILSTKNLSVQIQSCLQEMQTYKDGSFSRLLPFIEGKLLSSAKHTTRLLQNFGRVTAEMNTHLLDLESDVYQARELVWDMKNTLLNTNKVSYIEDPSDRKLVNYFYDIFEHKVVSIQNEFRRSIIHSDLNDNNVIVSGDNVKGIIDFGDMAYSPLIYEVAIALTYVMLANEGDPFVKAKAFLEGYNEVIPLKKEEIELLHILIPSRLCVSVCNSAKKKADGEDTSYVLVSERPAWELLRKWIAINPIWINKFFLDSLDFKTEVLDIDALKGDRLEYTGRSLSISYKDPIYMTGSAFQYMYDHLGNTYLDAYNNIPIVGHCHPNISKVISKQVRKLNTNTRYLYPELIDYAKALSHKLPDSLHKIFFVNSGSEASDLAIRMARTQTNKKVVAILESSYHGHTDMGIAISDYKHNGKGGNGKPENIITLPLPKIFKGRFSTGKEYALNAIDILSEEIEKGNTPSALIVESISGCGGQVPLAEEYLKTLEPFLKEHNILLIADEVQTGFGRMGKYFWAYEMHGVTPDILILGKPMGNGHPVAALVTTDTIANTFANGMEFFTSFGGNPVSCSVASEVLNIIEAENLQENALRVGEFMLNRLLDLKQIFSCIGDVRGQGLFIGIELVDAEGDPAEKFALLIKEKLKKRFILVGTDGPFNNVLKIKPPICFDMNNARHFLKQFDEILNLMENT